MITYIIMLICEGLAGLAVIVTDMSSYYWSTCFDNIIISAPLLIAIFHNHKACSIPRTLWGLWMIHWDAPLEVLPQNPRI